MSNITSQNNLCEQTFFREKERKIVYTSAGKRKYPDH